MLGQMGLGAAATAGPADQDFRNRARQEVTTITSVVVFVALAQNIS